MQKKLNDNLVFEDETEHIIFNHYSFCELIKHIMVQYGNIDYENANKKVEESFLQNVPTSAMQVLQLSHELEYHWAMLLLHGNMYWLHGIRSDYNEFEEEYKAWEAETVAKFDIKNPFEYITKEDIL